MHTRITPKKLAFTIAALISATPALAQQDDSEVMNLEQLVVTGFRGSLQKAKELKKESLGSQDSIFSEDIAKFPDLNLAESLQRIPGVTITREAGEGRQISLRGLNADFTQVQLNGMEALGTSSSAMDSRGTINRSRAFDFNIFASELFNQVDVKKTFSADMEEGGIGGTVNLNTARPFDYDGPAVAVTGKLGQNSLSDDISPRLAALLSNTWGDFGALVSFAYSERETNEQGYNTYRWRPLNASGSDISSLPQADQDKINNDGLFFSRGSRYSLFESDQTRTGTTLALQYQPSEKLDLGLDLLYGELNNDRREFHLQSRGSGSTALGCTGPAYAGEATCSRLVDVEYNAGDEVIYSSFEDTALHSESRKQYADTTIQQAVFHADWQVSDKLTLSGLIGSMESEFETGSAKVYLESFADMTIDYRGDRFYATNSYINGYDPTDINEFRYHEIDLEEDDVSNGFDNIKLDADYALTDQHRLMAGLSLKSFAHESGEASEGNLLRSEWENGSISDIVDPSLVYTNSGHERQSWLSSDVDGVLSAFGVNADLPADPDKDEVTEDTFAAYLQYEFHVNAVRGNVGLRYYETDIDSSGIINGSEYVTVSKNYDGILPTANVAWDITDSWVWRASASQNVTRPTLGAMGVSGTVNNDPLFGSSGLSISSGNPGLEPFESTNFDTSIEYYFEGVGYAALSYFTKTIDNFILNEVREVPYGETGYPLDLLGEFDENGNPQTADTLYTVSQPQNLDKTDFSGWEIMFQGDLSFLPAPWDNFGVVANYTNVDGEALYRGVGVELEDQYKSFPGLSEHTANFTLYYEADNWGARISSAYRSDYISSVASGSAEEDERGFHATNYMDFSAFYQFTDQLKVTVEGINLTDEREEQYTDSSDRLYNTTVSGQTYYIGVSYTFF